MSTESDARFWDRTSRHYAASAMADQAGYKRTLDRTRAVLRPDSRVLELGCGTGSTALLLAGDVRLYRATDISAAMIAIAEEKHAAAKPLPALSFRTATAEALMPEAGQFDAVLGFSYLHLVRDLPDTLQHIHALLADDGVFISKTPCVGEMNPLIPMLMLPAMRAIGKAPHASVFRAAELVQQIKAAGFDIVAVEKHATKGNDYRPYILARKSS